MEFVDYSKKSRDKTSVWHYFLRTANGQQAKCKRCQRIFKISGSTSTLHSHLLKQHSISIKKNKEGGGDSVRSEVPTTASASSSRTSVRSEVPTIASSSSSRTEDPPSKKQKLTDYYESRDSLPNVVTRMVVLDGLPLKVFCTSTDLRKLLQKNFKENIPKSPNSIKIFIMEIYEKEKSNLIAEIKVLKSKDIKFSMTLDEWTSLKSHRYLNLNIHYRSDDDQNIFNCLGLVRILGSMNAEACIAILEIRLNLFELHLHKDIVGSTTDGAAVMVKVGRTMSVPVHQLCFAHGVQLAVLDVLYKNSPQPTTSHVEADIRSDSGSETDEDVEVDDNEGFAIESRRQQGLLTDDYKNIIKKVRTVTKTFKNSPTKNDDVLQKYVKTEFGKELALLLDCKTRWSSLAIMLERFLKLKSCIQKALIDIRSNITFSDSEILCLKNLQTCLDMFKTTVEVLCRRDATILTADTALKFLVKSLEDQDTSTGMNLANALKRRIKERRLHAVVGTLQYLQNPNQFLNMIEDEDPFKKPTYEKVMAVLCQVVAMDGYDCPTTSTNLDSSAETLCESDDEPSSHSFKEQLNRQLASMSDQSDAADHQRQPSSSSSALDLPSLVHVEMALYENGGGCGEILKKALRRLQAIPPTSVESERAFSTAGIFCNKLRSRLSDQTLDAFMFLRSRYLKNTN